MNGLAAINRELIAREETIESSRTWRPTAEQWIKEGKPVVNMTGLTCRRFRSNEGAPVAERDRLQLGEPVRRLVLPKRIEKWLTSLQRRLVKTGDG